ncbi:hypothetical protein LINPERHAP1_LOCUS3420, partial [Linum perenne]
KNYANYHSFFLTNSLRTVIDKTENDPFLRLPLDKNSAVDMSVSYNPLNYMQRNKMTNLNMKDPSTRCRIQNLPFHSQQQTKTLSTEIKSQNNAKLQVF